MTFSTKPLELLYIMSIFATKTYHTKFNTVKEQEQGKWCKKNTGDIMCDQNNLYLPGEFK